MVYKKTAYTISKTAFDAVIFDLDGVVTDTATVHAEAWKRMFDEFLSQYAARQNLSFQPFDIDRDYRLYVDGKPRFDGVKSFLQSRGIELPEGQSDDLSGTETINGLGNLKNDYFLKYIQEHGAEVYRSTVDLIHCLKKHGFKTSIISSSKNCALILDSANLSDLFDVRVDGVDSEVLGIKGKPAPDIFLEAARQLKVKPERAVVIEDAISGVQAGRAGKFGLVIGVARTGDKESLLKNGADAAVEDLSEIGVKDDIEVIHTLPSALDSVNDIANQAMGKRIAVFLDYDGTLTPIVETPDRAIISEDMREAVIKLSHYCTVGIISGRDLKDVQRMVNIDSIVYAGSHGFDISGPEGLNIKSQAGTEFLPVLDKAEKELSEKLRFIEGMLVERKKFAIAIHYRLVNPEKIELVEEIVDKVASGYPELRKAYGKKIFELQPDIDWHKGRALLTLLSELKLDGGEVLPFYIGDDVTDEDAFRALKGRGTGIVVWDEPYETAASYSLKNPEEVREFLLKLVPLCKGGGYE
ncbi:MAG: trehalose-phosphatase [Nitrospirae bacterium]|nr:trehalose-phosphatase [Nitrospirota bacterium]